MGEAGRGFLDHTTAASWATTLRVCLCVGEGGGSGGRQLSGRCPCHAVQGAAAAVCLLAAAGLSLLLFVLLLHRLPLLLLLLLQSCLFLLVCLCWAVPGAAGCMLLRLCLPLVTGCIVLVCKSRVSS